MYPAMVEGRTPGRLSEIADWFETLAKAERSHANRFRKRSTRSPTSRSIRTPKAPDDCAGRR